MKYLIAVFSLAILLTVGGCASSGTTKSEKASESSTQESRMNDPFATAFMDAFAQQLCHDKDLYRECFNADCDEHARAVIYDCTQAADKEGILPTMAEINAGKYTENELRGVGENIGYCTGVRLEQERANELIKDGADEAAIKQWAEKCAAVFGQ